MRPAHSVVVGCFRPTKIVDFAHQEFRCLDVAHAIEHRNLVKAAVRRSFSGSAVVADNVIDHRVFEDFQVLQGINQPADLVIGMLQMNTEEVQLMQPFEESLAEKQMRMDLALATFEGLIDYQVADVTAAATYYIAEIYLEFSNALLTSERPAGLSEVERIDYELVIEEEAYPFEEQAIEVHEKNFEMLVGGIHNAWVDQSLDKLVDLMPGRYARSEISGGHLGSIDSYAYRMPVAPPPGMTIDEALEAEQQSDDSQASEIAAQSAE